MQLLALPLEASAFAPFGDVISAEGSGEPVNEGSARRRVAVPPLDLVRDDGLAVLAVYEARARTLPFDAVEMERHRLSDQVFLPLAGRRRCIVLVAPAGAPPGPEACRAFVSDGTQGVRLRAGTWHHGLLALDDGPWAVLERRARDGTPDCDVHRLPTALRLLLR